MAETELRRRFREEEKASESEGEKDKAIEIEMTSLLLLRILPKQLVKTNHQMLLTKHSVDYPLGGRIGLFEEFSPG